MAKRRRVEMKEIENERYKIVTFSKRRKGLFKKAQQLSANGVQVGILVFSPNGVPYVHGSFHELAERFLQAFPGGVEMGCSGCGSSQFLSGGSGSGGGVLEGSGIVEELELEWVDGLESGNGYFCSGGTGIGGEVLEGLEEVNGLGSGNSDVCSDGDDGGFWAGLAEEMERVYGLGSGNSDSCSGDSGGDGCRGQEGLRLVEEVEMVNQLGSGNSDFCYGGGGGGVGVWEELGLVEWEEKINGLGSLEELMEMERRLEEAKEKVVKRLNYLEEQKFVDSLFV